MARRNLNAVVRYLRQLVGSAGDSTASDAELLERYVHHRDETAFELLLWRHGALVFNVCRRILSSEPDAEDAFQATFLAFVRKASSISRRASVASWLYKVAYRVALEAREKAKKTAVVEKAGGEMLAVQPASDPSWSDVRPILDEELSRLPERLRRPLVLCYLEGKSNEEAAKELGCRLGTIYSRLSRGREMLRQRLLRRGVTLSVAGLSAALAAHAIEAAPMVSLVRSAARAALAFADPSATVAVSPRVTALAEGVLRTMFVTKLKIVAVMLLVVSLAAGGGVLTHGWTAAPQSEPNAEDAAPKQKDDRKKDAEPIAVKAVKPKRGGLELTDRRPAEILAAQQQQVVPLVAGIIKEVLVDIGDCVKKGQTLIALDAPLLAKEVEEAEASLELAAAQANEAAAIVENAREKLSQKLGGRSEVARAQAALKVAKARMKVAQVALEKARIQGSYTRLTAACDGVVTRRTADAGNFVQSSDSRLLRPLLTVQRIDQLRIVARIPGDLTSYIKRGTSVDLEFNSLPGGRVTGQKIARFSPTLDSVDRTMAVEIDVPNADNRLLPGMYGTIKIHLKKSSPDGLIVPSSCVLGGDPQFFVYIIRDGKAHRTPITLSIDDGTNSEIAKGIDASDLIITNPKLENVDKLHDGAPVKVEKSP